MKAFVPLAVTLVVASLLSNAAFADGAFKDDPVPSPLSWSGLYVGLQAGYSWGDVDWNLDYPFATPIKSTTKFDTDHFIAGGHLGYQRQFDAWVIGAEVAVDAGFDEQTIGGVNLWSPGVGSLETRMGPLFTATGRLGYARDRWLAYAKGGYAGANISLNSDDGVPPNYYSKSSDWHNGWTVGGGLEYALFPSMSVGVEYDYVDLGGVSATVPITYADGSQVGSATTIHDASSITQMVMARVSFRLDRDRYTEPAPLK
jgi:outer membrane immunogenic protein